MTPEAITAVATLIAAAGALIVALVGAFVARSNSLRAASAASAAKVAAESAKADIIATKEGVFELGKQVDGRLSELLIETRKSARAEGVAAGEQAQRDRANPEAQP